MPACFHRVVLALAVALLLAPRLAAGLDTTATALVGDPERFDQQKVSLSGPVSRLDPRTSRAGNKYYTFRIAEVTVYSPGAPPAGCRDGATAAVEGVFKKAKQVGHHTFRNQVDAERVSCR